MCSLVHDSKIGFCEWAIAIVIVATNSKGTRVSNRYYKPFLGRLTGSSLRDFDGDLVNYTQEHKHQRGNLFAWSSDY